MTRMRFFVAGSMLALMATQASAQEECASGDGDGSLACGDSAIASGDYSVGVGETWATGTDSTAVGHIAVAADANTTAIGAWAYAGPMNSSAFGYNTAAEGLRSTALGANAVAQQTGSLAIGWNSYAIATGSVAIGDTALSDGVNSVAIGANSSNATYANSVALGAGTVNTAANQVAIGGRTLTGVAAGTLSADSTDAVNGSQLYATNSALEQSLMAQSAASAQRLGAVDFATDLRVDALESLALGFGNDLKRLDSKLAGSTAIAIAMGGGVIFPDSRITITANLATYDGAHAGALQVGALVAPKTAITGAVAGNFNKRGKIAGRIGVSFGL